MELTSDVKSFLDSYSEIIDEGDFKFLFERAYKTLSLNQVKQIYDVCKTANILPKNIEDQLPSMLRVYIKVIGAGATFIGWSYDNYLDKQYYIRYEGKHGKITGLSIPADYENDDGENYLWSYWDFKTDDGIELGNIAGESFRLDKPII